MKKIKLFNLLSTSLVCSSLLMTAPVSAAEAHSDHLSPNSQMPIEKKESVVPNTTTSFVLTKNNQKQTVDDTVKYIESQGIKVKSWFLKSAGSKLIGQINIKKRKLKKIPMLMCKRLIIKQTTRIPRRPFHRDQLLTVQ